MNRHLGMCDASCAVALTGTRFLVADDEHNQLAIYDAGGGGPATQAIGLGKLVGANTKEVDLEGAAELADRIYWISSHGRTAKGQQAEERYTFFGSQVTDLDDKVKIRRIGKPVPDLLSALLGEPAYKDLGLQRAAQRSPREEGLNIEGLGPARDGGLLIGFRSPLVEGMALLAHLLNPADTVAGREPRFGPPRLLDLGGLGVRGLEYWAERDLELVVAGPVTEGSVFRLHVLGSPTEQRRIVLPDGFNAEAVVAFPGERSKILLLSDDGAVERSGMKAKKLPAGHPDRYFRSLWIPA